MKFNKLAVAVFLVVDINSNVIARDYDTKFETDLNIHYKFFKRDRNKDKLLDLNEAYSGFMHTPDYEDMWDFSNYDKDDNRGLDYEEYSNKIISKKGYDKKLKKKKIKDRYIRFTTTMRSYIDFTNADKNRDKVLSFDEIDTVLSRSDLNEYFIRSDINQDGVLNFREFSNQYVDLIERNKRLEEIKRKKEEDERLRKEAIEKEKQRIEKEKQRIEEEKFR